MNKLLTIGIPVVALSIVGGIFVHLYRQQPTPWPTRSTEVANSLYTKVIHSDNKATAFDEMIDETTRAAIKTCIKHQVEDFVAEANCPLPTRSGDATESLKSCFNSQVENPSPLNQVMFEQLTVTVCVLQSLNNK